MNKPEKDEREKYGWAHFVKYATERGDIDLEREISWLGGWGPDWAVWKAAIDSLER